MRHLYEYVLTETEMKPFIREVLVRCFYEYGYDSERQTVITNANPEAFRRIHARASCESLSKDGSLVVTEEDASDMFYMARLLQQTGKAGMEPGRKRVSILDICIRHN